MKNRAEFLWGVGGTLAVASLTACLYLSGVAYHAGYVRELRLPAGLIPLSYQAALEAGGYAWMYLGASTLAFLIIVSLGGMTTVLLHAALSRRRARLTSTAPPLIASRLRSNDLRSSDQMAAPLSTTQWGVEPAIQSAFDVTHRVATVFFFLTFGLIGLVVLLQFSAKAGADFARDRMDCPGIASEPVPPGCAPAELELTDNAQKLVGRVIQCTEHHCVVQVQAGLLVLRLDDIKRIDVPADSRSLP
jgi:hypothetical protein